MPKNREKTRANKRKEQMLNRRNLYLVDDPTPYEAVKSIIEKERKSGRWVKNEK